MARGHERMVTCSKCGRQTRRDKAVWIEKAVFVNPLQRHEVYSETYVPKIMREVPYCPSCGKHLRVYDKKIKMAQERHERRFGYEMPNRPRAKPPATLIPVPGQQVQQEEFLKTEDDKGQ